MSELGYSLSNMQIETYENIEGLIRTFDKINICHGSMSSNLSDIKLSYGHQKIETFGVIKHLKCSTILTDNKSGERLQNIN